MKISINWLKEYLDFDLPLSALVERMNMIGLVVEEWEEKEGDTILDIETYANRPDTLGHLGIARELAAALKLPLKAKEWVLTETNQPTSDLVSIQIKDEYLCRRYSGIVVRGLEVGPSPDWLRRRIEAMGLKSINNVVDVTNYVLFATAHPIHAFDLEKLSGSKIVIRRAEKGERLKTLEGEEVELATDMLVIADEKKPVALAGIIGGEESGVQSQTRDVFIESAYFNPISIRRTTKSLGIQTEASYRFERGADISYPPQAAIMAASLLCLLGGKATKGILDAYPEPEKNREIILRKNRIPEILGVEIEEEFVQDILTRLGFRIKSYYQGVWQVVIPFFRVDIEREIDLIEELARFFGYDRIPAVVPPLKIVDFPPHPHKKDVRKIREVLFHHGFNEVINWSFSDRETEMKFQPDLEAVEIRNPISSKAHVLRTSLFGGLLENARWNQNRGVEGIHLFEIGNVYYWKEKTHVEKPHLALLSTGPLEPPHWQLGQVETDFFHLKGVCEALLSQLRYEPFSFEEEECPFLENGYSLAIIYRGEKVGRLGDLKRSLLDFYSLKPPVFGAELDLALLFKKQARPFRFVPVAKFPEVRRDISFLVSKEISYQRIEEEIKKLSLSILKDFLVIDLFSGRSLPPDKVSLTLRLFYRHPARTLLAEEVDRAEKKIISRLKSLFKIQLRGE